MARDRFVVAALLLTGLAGAAVAADIAGHKQSQNAQKIIAALEAAGVSKNLQDIVRDTDARIDHGYYTLAETRMMGGNLSVRYHLSLGTPRKELELTYTPDHSHLQCSLGSDRIAVSYHLNF